jgi:hypothetical protein
LIYIQQPKGDLYLILVVPLLLLDGTKSHYDDDEPVGRKREG